MDSVIVEKGLVFPWTAKDVRQIFYVNEIQYQSSKKVEIG